MTTTTLERGNEIKYELICLREALNQINEARIFRMPDGGSCSRGSADPFLSVLNLRVRDFGITEITNRIEILQKEFDSL